MGAERRHEPEHLENLLHGERDTVNADYGNVPSFHRHGPTPGACLALRGVVRVQLAIAMDLNVRACHPSGRRTLGMIPAEKVYSDDEGHYDQKTVSQRIEALFLNNIGLVVTRDQIIKAAIDPKTGRAPENWHQRLSELRTDKGYTILSWRDWKQLAPQEYVMPHAERRERASRRTVASRPCWSAVLQRAGDACEWTEDGQRCGLREGDRDPIGGGTVKLTPDHVTPHSINPNADPDDPACWQALCGRHQVMKKNYWDSGTGKINVLGILQSVGERDKREALQFLKGYFGEP